MIFFNKANTKTSLRNGSSLFFASTTNRQPTQNETDGNQAPAGSVYSPTLIKVMGWTTRRPFARHQRSSALFKQTGNYYSVHRPAGYYSSSNFRIGDFRIGDQPAETPGTQSQESRLPHNLLADSTFRKTQLSLDSRLSYCVV
jgi:hypothetical protein